jgi:hypothetical protein
MTHDHEAVQLAVASLDFDLTPDERTRMEAGLAACPECAAIAASHLQMQSMLQRLPAHDASPHVRQRVMRASLVPPRSNQWQVLLVAAALFGLLLAAAVAAGAFRNDPLDQITDVPPSSAPALGDVISPEPSQSQDPLASPPGPGGGSVFGEALRLDSIAEVVSGRLRIRSEPRVADDSIKYEPLLPVGAHLMILEGPVVANDYDWYQVAAWDPADPEVAYPAGWVSRGDHDGTPWIAAKDDVCPRDTITMADVAGLAPAERVACYGNRELRLRAYVGGSPEPYECTADPGCAVDGPRWLTELGGWTAEFDAGTKDAPTGPPLAVDPSGSVADSAIPGGAMIQVIGSFDHPAAEQCHALAGAASGPTTDRAARLQCRARFALKEMITDPAYPRLGAGITASDRLRVRSAPGLEGERFELLSKGTPVWVVNGPIIAADYEWFQVIVPGVENDGVPRVGWVAESDHGGERWLARRTLKCPQPGDVTVDDLTRLMRTAEPHGGLACFRDSPIAFTGEVEMSCGESRPTWQVDPEWLGPHAFYTLAITNRTDVVNAHVRPDLGVPADCGGGIEAVTREIRGHFDDGDAEACAGPAPTGTSAADAEILIRFWCQAALVVDDIEPMPPLSGP